MKGMRVLVCLLLAAAILGGAVSACAEGDFRLCGRDWTKEEFQDLLNDLYAAQRKSGEFSFDADERYAAVYEATNNGAYIYGIYRGKGGVTERTDESIFVTDGQLALATTMGSSAPLFDEEILIAVSLGLTNSVDLTSTMLLRAQAKNNGGTAETDFNSYRYDQNGFALLIVEK